MDPELKISAATLWKKDQDAKAVISKDFGSVARVLKDGDDMVKWMREEGASDDEVDASVEEYKGVDDTSGALVTATVSSSDVDRENDTINHAGWDLKDYRKNPIILLNHDSRGESLPIGRATSTFKSAADKSLKQVIAFNGQELDERGYRVGEFFRAGVMRAFSVGFQPTEWSVNEERSGDDFWSVAIDFKKQILLENSAVNVPANPFALADAKSMGLLPGMLEAAFKAIDEAGGWVFSSDEVKNLVASAREVDGRSLILFDMGAKAIAELPFAIVEEQVPAAPEPSEKAPAVDAGDTSEFKKILGEWQDGMSAKLSDFQETIQSLRTAKTGRLD